MKFRKLNLPENYYIRDETSYDDEINLYDNDIPGENAMSRHPHRQVARVSKAPTYIMLDAGVKACAWYWDMADHQGDRVDFTSLEAAMCHVEAMAGMGMLGHGYKKGMLNETT
jgi:hypothetical protein